MREVEMYRRFFSNQRGMTLLEIIIVVTILAALIAILGNKIAGAGKKARVKEARIEIGLLSDALNQYNLDCGHYPGSEQGLTALAPGGEAGCANWGPDPYIKKVPVDPWGQPYVYYLENGNFTVMSYGEDKSEGGTGYNKDISSND